jgi:hypothetical protein
MAFKKVDYDSPDLFNKIFRVKCLSKSSRTNWYKHEKAISIILTEYWKLLGGRVMGQF